MKRKLTVLLALLLCAVTLLSSCGTVGVKKVVAEGVIGDETPTLTSAVKTELGGIVTQLAGDLVVLRDNSAADGAVTAVYDVAAGAVLWTGKDTVSVGETVTVTVRNTVQLMEQGDTAWYVTRTETETLTAATGKVNVTHAVSLYDGKGTQFATSADKNAMPDATLDLIRFEEKVYRIAEDDSVAYAFDMSRTAAMPAVNAKVGGYYYATDAGTGVSVYDAALKLVAFYGAPSYALDTKIHLLNGGNVLIQYATLEALTAESYTYTQNGNLYTLHSFLLEAESGKLKELDLDYLVSVVRARDLVLNDLGMNTIWKSMGFSEEVENVATVFYVEDGRLNTEYHAGRTVIMKNNGGIKSVLELLKGDPASRIIGRASTNRWIVGDGTGAVYLVDEKGAVLGEITATTQKNSEGGGNYFVVDGMVYDWDLNEKYDLEAAKAVNVLLYMDHGILFENEDGDAVLYNATKGEARIVAPKEALNRNVERIVTRKFQTGEEWDSALGDFVPVYGYTYSSALFVIVDSSDLTRLRYEIYNDEGVRLTVLESMAFDHMNCFVTAAGSSNAVLLHVTDSVGKDVYYRFG